MSNLLHIGHLPSPLAFFGSFSSHRALPSSHGISNAKFDLKQSMNLRKAESQSTQQREKLRVGLVDRVATHLTLLATVLTLSTSVLIALPAFSQAAEASKNVMLFQKACIGCHVKAGNILQPGATLFMKDLERNGLVGEDAIYNITYYGKGRMPGFGEKCTPAGQCTFGPRLQDDEIKMLAEFVKSQAEKGWPDVETYSD